MKSNRVFWGISIMFVGAVMLLKTMGFIHFNLWTILGPSILILIGLWFVYLAIVNPKPPTPESVSLPRDGAEEMFLVLNHGAGKMQVQGGAADSELLVGSFNSGIQHEVNRVGTTANVTLKPFSDPLNVVLPGNFRGLNWDIALNSSIPVIIDLNSGANESTLNLTDVNLKKLDVSTGASKTDIYFSNKSNACSAAINAGVAEVNLHIPSNVSASIRVQGKELSSIKVDTNRFAQSGDVYQSMDYNTAEYKLDIEVKPGLGEINIF
jgi:hypothetical protein